MLKEQLPLVSCIMPTYNRRQFVPLALKYFLRQDYENKELIIIDDGDDAVEDIIPLYNQIKYYRLPNKISLGAKLNRGCEHASGDIIVNWDDDDWYSSRRLSYLVEQFQSHETEVCGINQLFYFDIGTKKAFQYRYPDSERKWLLGSSLCYKRKYWQANRFANVNVGMDALFVWKAEPQKVKVLPDPTIAVHLIHSNNVSAKKTDGECWHAYPVEELKKILDEDWHHYSNGLMQEKDRSTISFNTEKIVAEKPKTIQNIFACLVHDYEDCVIDLVRNLHYHDPSSIIILYNGGNNPNLIKKKFPFDKFNAVVHPKPSPVKHGYLHQYALNCMQFALQNFNFDTFTIVDSDQLAIRSGYTKYLDESVASFSNIGLFSCRPQRVSPNEKDIRVWPAVQAFKEFDLWKPLLQTFDNGEEKFVHWTFWPSTVFTKNAICDLLKLFRENKLLQSIMSRSEMWAAEEVVFPTLIKLL
ncbi:MAG: glycosyltransferase family 2 protein, partial [Ilyomonas sp.]